MNFNKPQVIPCVLQMRGIAGWEPLTVTHP